MARLSRAPLERLTRASSPSRSEQELDPQGAMVRPTRRRSIEVLGGKAPVREGGTGEAPLTSLPVRISRARPGGDVSLTGVVA